MLYINLSMQHIDFIFAVSLFATMLLYLGEGDAGFSIAEAYTAFEIIDGATLDDGS